MSQQNSDIQYEGRDTNNRAIAIMGLVILAILFAISLSMIPFTQHMWNAAGESVDTGKPFSIADKPPVELEVHPGTELAKFHEEISKAEIDKEIQDAMQASLDQGFPARKS